MTTTTMEPRPAPSCTSDNHMRKSPYGRYLIRQRGIFYFRMRIALAILERHEVEIHNGFDPEDHIMEVEDEVDGRAF